MSEEFDPYKVWLEIDNKTASTTHYKLLGLTEFEGDKDRITAAADKAIRKIRSQKPGAHAAEWSKVLDELQEVKALLLDNQKKDAYDDDLRFADEFVRELEGGMKRDPAAAAVAASMAPKRAATRPIKQDPCYPPGMAPKVNSSPPAARTTIDDIEMRAGAAPKPIDRKDSPFYPPSRPAVDQAKPPEPEATPDPAPAVAHSPTLPNDPLLPAAASDIAPSEQLAPPPGYVPQQPAIYQQPQLAPYQAPNAYPPQPNPYYQQPNAYQHPAAYPQNYYPPPAGQIPPAAYPAPGQPMPQYTLPQPGYGYGPPMAQPMAHPVGYGAPGMTGPYGGMPPMAAPMYGAPMAMPMSPPAYMSAPPTPAALDPMAPVAIPGTALAGGMTSPAPLPTAFGAPLPSAAIPMGTAVAAAEASSLGSPSNPAAASPFDAPAKEVRSSSATSVMLAAKREKSSQQTLMLAGIGGLLLVAVAVLVFFAASGNFGKSPVATNPATNGSHNVPAATPDKSPVITVPPVKPLIKPQPAKPEPAMPVEPDKTKVPEIKPMPEKPAEPKPEIKPETKPEPPKPEPTKPEPTKPEPPKPEVPPGEMPTKEEVVQLGKALQNAKNAIGEFNFAEADTELAKADKLAKLPEHRGKLDRLKEVEGYVKQFHERLVQAATGMDGGESFKIGSSTFVGMVEANPKQVVLRIAGQNKTYQYNDLPIHLAAALADMKLAGTDPVSKVVKGAYVFCNKASTPAQLKDAKEFWQEATLGGADVSHLMSFPMDSYDLAKDFDPLKKSDAAAKPEAKGDSEKGTPKTDAKGAPDAKAILDGKL